MRSKPLKILLGVTASIAAYKACDLIKDLKKTGYEVYVVMTKDAHHLVTPLSLQTFSGNEVTTDFFAPSGKPRHIKLAEEADLILVAPATADCIAKIANGFADDALTSTILASTAPVLVAPAMNDKMWNNPFTQENIERLKKNGIRIIQPIKGMLACGYEGMGHLAPLEDIVKAVNEKLSSPRKRGSRKGYEECLDSR
jgi:phosphopantothenoylcysteine decarboxylase/phosphopantothenate--cysteine ligase